MKSTLPKRLHLTGRSWFGHYSFPIYLVGIVVLFVGGLLAMTPPDIEHSMPLDREIHIGGEVIGVGLLVTCLLIIAALSLVRQFRMLKLEHFDTSDDAQENLRRVTALANKEGWRINASDERRLCMHVPARWSDFCWGEMVSVLVAGNQVALNSICDPIKSNPSLVSFGRNSRNVEKLKAVLRIV